MRKYTVIVRWDNNTTKEYTVGDYKTAKEMINTARENGYFATIAFN